jgi:8-oxo-dGTP diphosphatase
MAVLCFVVKGDSLLLIEKLRGLGAGKVNAPGGRLEPGETPEEAAVRELQEEVSVTPHDLMRVGVLGFSIRKAYGRAAE